MIHLHKLGVEQDFLLSMEELVLAVCICMFARTLSIVVRLKEIVEFFGKLVIMVRVQLCTREYT